MLIIISPAKTLDYDSPIPATTHSIPDFLNNSEQLLAVLRRYSPEEIGQLMSISAKLANLNVQRYMDWHQPFTVDNARQALFAFKGDVYSGLDAHSLSTEDLNWAQNHLRILSGLYGILRPLDLMQPYRLEMGTQLNNEYGNNLYHFWQSRVTDAVNTQLGVTDSTLLVNLASNEYSRAVNFDAIDAEVITPIFKDWKNGQYKIISFYAKKARGLMSAWIIKNRITQPDDLTKFDVAGYFYCAEQSTLNQLVFHRNIQ